MKIIKKNPFLNLFPSLNSIQRLLNIKMDLNFHLLSVSPWIVYQIYSLTIAIFNAQATNLLVVSQNDFDSLPSCYKLRKKRKWLAIILVGFSNVRTLETP